MPPISINGTEPDSPEFELWDHLFKLRPTTRIVQRELDEHLPKFDQVKDGDELVAALGTTIDIRLAPSDGKRTKPSQLIQQKWEAGKLSLEALQRFAEQVAEPSVPPT